MYDFLNFADRLKRSKLLIGSCNTKYADEKTSIESGQSGESQSLLIEALLKGLEIQNLDLNLCTDVEYDFKKRIWTDGFHLNTRNFMRKWEQKFGMLWDNLDNVLPLQPYQPEFVYFQIRIRNQTASVGSAGIVPATHPKKRWYQCTNSTKISIASYFEAFDECNGINSTILTYWTKVF